MINKIAIIGGDLRIVKLAEMLVDEGVEVFTYALENSELSEEIKCKDLIEAISFCLNASISSFNSSRILVTLLSFPSMIPRKMCSKPM